MLLTRKFSGRIFNAPLMKIRDIGAWEYVASRFADDDSFFKETARVFAENYNVFAPTEDGFQYGRCKIDVLRGSTSYLKWCVWRFSREILFAIECVKDCGTIITGNAGKCRVAPVFLETASEQLGRQWRGSGGVFTVAFCAKKK